MDADIIVVGAGPAGCTAARICAAAGLDTLVVERAAFPRDKPCAGALSPRAAADLTRIFRLEGVPAEFGVPRLSLRALIYRRPRDSVRRDGARQRPAAPRHLTPSWLDYRRLALPGDQPLAHVTRRATLDQFLVGCVETAGARVQTRTEVVSLSQDEGGVWVTVREAVECGGPSRPTLLRPLRAGYLIGADGAASVVARGLGRRGVRGPVAECLSLFVPMERDRAEAVTEGSLDFHFGLVRGGFGWAFPAEAGLAIGVGALAWGEGLGRRREGRDPGDRDRRAHGRDELAAALTWVLSVYGLRSRPEGPGQPQGWLVPLGGCRRLWGEGRVLLAGDAAGTANPLTGEGIGPAVASAELAAGAVVDAVRAEAGTRFAAALGVGKRIGEASRRAGAAGYARSLWRDWVAGQRPLLAAARSMAVLSPENQGRLFGRPVFSRLTAMMAETRPGWP